MVNPIKSVSWVCDECGNDYEWHSEAEECCKNKEKKK